MSQDTPKEAPLQYYDNDVRLKTVVPILKQSVSERFRAYLSVPECT